MREWTEVSTLNKEIEELCQPLMEAEEQTIISEQEVEQWKTVCVHLQEEAQKRETCGNN